MTTILGVDPGATGAIAMVTPMVECWDMPATPHDIAALFRTFDASTTRVYLEAVHSMPGQGVASTFKFGMGYGVLIGILAAYSFPYVTVTPSKWKTEMGLRGADKNESRRKAQELFPTAALGRVRDHGRAEALLLAYWGMKERQK